MKTSLIQQIHTYIRSAIYRRDDISDDAEERSPSKRYLRMQQVALPSVTPLSITLSDALKKRRSRRDMGLREPLSVSELSNLLGYAIGKVGTNRYRPYASGGGLYPLETYVLINNVAGLERGVYHYAPDEHILERLWPMQEGAGFSSLLRAGPWVSFASCVIVFTCVWERSSKKYEDFAYLLSLLESGGAGQNIALVATALNLSSCPVAAFDDRALERLLDVRTGEQAIYTIAIGKESTI